jgi:hypothetical protein
MSLFFVQVQITFINRVILYVILIYIYEKDKS